MRKLFSVVAIFAALVLLFTSTVAQTLAGPASTAPTRILRTRNAPAAPAAGNLLYHAGGKVQTGVHHTYAIFWGSTFGGGSTYYNNILQYFRDVAHDSGQQSNVYYSDTQYYQTIGGVTTHISYTEGYSGTWTDTVLPASGCSDTSGGTLRCYTDAQFQTEVARAISIKHWPSALHNEYFVFTASGISSCFDSSGAQCAFSYYCAYHSSYWNGSAYVLYANMPFAGYNNGSCGSGNYPNSLNSDATINVLSHEANETITDPLGNAWYDTAGNENGDKCAWNFGTPLGGTNGTYYNQVINGHHYWLQQEWSNSSGGCVQTGQ